MLHGFSSIAVMESLSDFSSPFKKKGLETLEIRSNVFC